MDRIQQLKNLQKIRRMANLLDTAIGIPGTKFRIGLDPILGLIPGGGDLITAGMSAYLVFLATRFGLEKPEIAKMVKNIMLETTIGFIPIAGDLFDAYFKANIRNLEILERHLAKTENQDVTIKNPDPAVVTVNDQSLVG
ncbi:MAG: DUF4112 domain-containing protein [Pleurocapsa sp.]